MNLKTMTLFTLSIMTAMALAPTANAASPVDVAVGSCPSGNPDAWVNACVETYSTTRTVRAYTVDKTPETTEVCPVNRICVDVPVVLELIEPRNYVLTHQMAKLHWNVNLNGVVDDVCDVVGIHCKIEDVAASLVSTKSDGTMTHVMLEDGDDVLLLPIL